MLTVQSDNITAFDRKVVNMMATGYNGLKIGTVFVAEKMAADKKFPVP